MPKMSEAELLERESKGNIGEEVLQAIREIRAGGGRRFTVQVALTTERGGEGFADVCGGSAEGGAASFVRA